MPDTHERQVARKCQHRRDTFRAGTDQSRMDAGRWGRKPAEDPAHNSAGHTSARHGTRPRPVHTAAAAGRRSVQAGSGQYPLPAATGRSGPIRRERPPAKTTPAILHHAPSCHWRPQKALPRRLPASIMPAGEAGKSVVDRQPSSLLSFLKIIFGFILCSQIAPRCSSRTAASLLILALLSLLPLSLQAASRPVHVLATTYPVWQLARPLAGRSGKCPARPVDPCRHRLPA